MSRVLDEHRQYLRDRQRLAAYDTAIAAVVRPGDSVIDLGSGSGILGLMAARAGARIVYAIEATGIVGLASQVRDANGLRDRVRFLRAHSSDVALPERADVIVSDQIGRFGFEAGILQFFAGARERLLKPAARFIPAAVHLHVAPVESEPLYRRIDFWDTKPAGFDFHDAREIAINTVYPVRYRPGDLLGRPVDALRLDLSVAGPGHFELQATLEMDRAGILHGIGGWFHAELAPGVPMTNSPLDPRRIRRRQVFLPVDRPSAVTRGERIAVRLRILPEQLIVTWEVRREGGAARRPVIQSTLRGMLVTREDLERTRPSFRPALTSRGVARRLILELCDGARTLAEIEEEVYRRHAPLFAGREEAALFVAEVVTRYARQAGEPATGGGNASR